MTHTSPLNCFKNNPFISLVLLQVLTQAHWCCNIFKTILHTSVTLPPTFLKFFYTCLPINFTFRCSIRSSSQKPMTKLLHGKVSSRRAYVTTDRTTRLLHKKLSAMWNDFFLTLSKFGKALPIYFLSFL